MIPLLFISGSIFTSGFIGGILGYNCFYCSNIKKNNNKKNVSFNIDNNSNYNDSILKSPSTSSPDILTEFSKKYDKIYDIKL